jgi:cell division protein FtsI (penicillin-binding protein 3)
VPDELPPPTLVASQLNDLADADTASGQQNILEDGEEDPPPAIVANFVGPQLPGPVQQAGPKAPNFVGKSMRTVLAEAAAKGVVVAPKGSGIARGQKPRPGAVLHEGERVRVQFSR